MEKTEIRIAVEPTIKEEADDILKRLGITISDAVNILLNQIILNGGLPFNIKLPVPNEKTLKAMYDSENDIDLHKFETAEDMFKELGI